MMPTIGDVIDKIHRANFGVMYFGATESWKKEFGKRVTIVGKAIAYDLASSKEVVYLSRNVELGPIGHMAYMNLCSFIKKHGTTSFAHPL